MGPVGGTSDAGGLGGASFRLFVDDAPLVAGLKRAERQARTSSQAIGTSIRGGTNNAAMGLLALSQAVDDVQYGFRAIVNNIPQVAMMFTGSAGLAGAIGITAVAINQLVNHWDDIKARLENTQVWRTGQGAVDLFSEAIKNNAETLKKWGEAALATSPIAWALVEGFKALSAESASGTLAAAMAAKAAGAGKLVEKIGDIRGKGEENRAKNFKEAIEAYGGGAKLIKDVVDAQMKATPGANRNQTQMRVLDMIARGLAGENVNRNFFGNQFKFGLQDIEAKKSLEEEKKVQDKKLVDAAKVNKARDEDMEAQARNEEQALKHQHDVRTQELEDKLHELEVQKHNIMEKQKDIGHIGIFGGTQEMMKTMQTGILTEAKQQTKALRDIDKKMWDLNELLRKQKARFG